MKIAVLSLLGMAACEKLLAVTEESDLASSARWFRLPGHRQNRVKIIEQGLPALELEHDSET